MKRFLQFCILSSFFIFPAISFAGPISFDVPVGELFYSTSGVFGELTVTNATGSGGPVLPSALFDDVVLKATEANGTILTFDLGNIPSGTSASQSNIGPDLLITQVLLTATLNPKTFQLINGETFVAGPVSFLLLPSTGSYLLPGDYGTIYAPLSVPEPSSISLLVGSLIGVIALAKRKSQKAD